jgi:uncharacterized protein (DUF4415 family)
VKKSDDTARYTAEELATMRRRGESRTDWARFDATTQAELEASITADPDDVHESGRGYRTRMNNVLRAFVESRRRMRQS